MKHHINVGGEKLVTHLRRAIVLLFFSCCIAPLAFGQLTLKVKIQSTPMERQLLFAKLNERAATHHIRFVLVEEGFDYRVAYGVAGPVMTPYGPAAPSASVTKVFDPAGAELFTSHATAAGPPTPPPTPQRKKSSSASESSAASARIVAHLVPRVDARRRTRL
jgi:hypothetical protein